MATQTEKAAAAPEEKKKRQRSPNFPAVGLREAIDRLNKFMEADGRAGAPPEIAARHIGFSSAHGAAMSVLAALKRFGLVEDRGGRVVPTQRGIEINSLPATHEKRIQAIREAATAPPIYAELLEQYKDTGLPHDETLEGELIAYKAFNPNGVKDFIKGFRDTLEFSGLSDLKVLDSDSGAKQEPPKVKIGDFVQWESNGKLNLPEAKRLVRIDEESGYGFLEGSLTGVLLSELIPADPPPGSVQRLNLGQSEVKRVQPRQGATMRQDVYTLAEGDIVLQWPSTLSQESLDEIKDWLKLMERKITRSVTESKQTDSLDVWKKLGEQS